MSRNKGEEHRTTKVLAELDGHINNGGLTFKVVDFGAGPTLRITSSHFGNNVHCHDMIMTRDYMKALGKTLS